MRSFNTPQISIASKKTFNNLFLMLIVVLMVLPFIETFNEFLTRIIEIVGLGQLIERVIVPYEVMLARTVVSFFGIETLTGSLAFEKSGVPYAPYISWNCIGWQSFVILLLSLKMGLNKNFTTQSKLEAVIIGFLGTFFLNLFRMSLVIVTLYYFGKSPSIVVHNYIAILISIIWLFFFWWFSYSFVLETKESRVE